MAKLKPGSQLGPYEVVSLLGAGGMGEVYKARDTRLNRLIAMKVLPEHIANKPEARQRFEREAQTIARLNHPHICVLHDAGSYEGTDFLVMEYLEGQTLADRLSRGAVPIPQALEYSVQIADALDKAHRHGVTHRDLKPGNIMLTKSGAKLLDFGLARLRPGTSSSFPTSEIPTDSDNLTGEGMILGTLQYMSPEQLEGKEADSRSDIFSLGSIVFEMVTGARPFEGKSRAALIGAILEREPPPLSELQAAASPVLERLVKRCLAKDPDERWQSATDLSNELKWILDSTRPEVTRIPVRSPSAVPRTLTYWKLVSAVLFIGIVALAGAYVFRREPERSIVRFSISPPEKTSFDSSVNANVGRTRGVMVSPDGRHFAFNARDASGKVQLWVQGIDSLSARAIPDTDGASGPFWSPDSRSIAFFAQNKLKRIDVSGGVMQTICDATPGAGGGTWNTKDVILFAPIGRPGPGPLFRVAATGGTPEAVTKLDNQLDHRFPWFLPDGRHFLYKARGENPGVFVGDLDSGLTKRLLFADSRVEYVPPGYLLFVRQGILLAQDFDAKKLELIGEPRAIAEHVAYEGGGGSGFSSSNNGVLTYRAGAGTDSEDVKLVWLDRGGKQIEQVGKPGPFRGVDLSSDGKRLAAHRHDGNGGDIWAFDSQHLTPLRLTFDASQDNSSPIWSADSSRILYSSLRGGMWGIYAKPSDGAGEEETLFQTKSQIMPLSWSSDGKYLVFWQQAPKTGAELVLLPLQGERKPQSLVQSIFTAELRGQISPDAKWIAYSANESGQVEIYVKPFPSGPGRWQVSPNGGRFPRWRADGKEIFYLSTTGVMMVLDVKPATASTFEYGTARGLFPSQYFDLLHQGNGNFLPYAVSRDGQRFLMPQVPDAIAEPSTNSVTAVLDWQSLLKK